MCAQGNIPGKGHSKSAALKGRMWRGQYIIAKQKACKKHHEGALASGTVNLVRRRAKKVPPLHSAANRLPRSLLAVPGGPMKRTCSPARAAKSISLTSTSRSIRPVFRLSIASSNSLLSEPAKSTQSEIAAWDRGGDGVKYFQGNSGLKWGLEISHSLVCSWRCRKLHVTDFLLA